MLNRVIVISTIFLVSANQTFAEEITQELDEVVVSASRVKEKIKEAPVTINVVPAKEIENVKPRNTEEVLRRLPGINSSNFGGESELTSIRIPTHFTNPYTLVLVDGVPTASYGSGSSGNLNELNIDNIASIEVVKGPGSALYGSNAIGGVINVITKDPSPEPQADIWSELGEYGQWRSGLSGSTSGENFSVNGGLNYINSDNSREHSAVDKKAGNIKLQYLPSEESLVTFKFDYVNFDNESDGSINEEDFLADWQQDYNTFTYSKLEKLSPLLSYSHYFTDAEFKTTLSLRNLDHEVLPTYGIRPQGFMQYVGSLSEINSNDVNLQVLYSQDFEWMHSRVIGGVDFELGETDSDTYFLAVQWNRTIRKFTGYTMGDLSKSYDVTTKVGAPYLQFQTVPLKNFRVTAGARYDSLKYEVDDKLGSGDSGDMDFSHVSPKVGVTYDITPNLNAYVSYSEGFVVPTTSQLLTSSWANSDLDPEEAENYEVGMRSSFWNRMLDFDVALYSMDITDKIVTRDINSWVREYVNAGETSHRGIEVAAELKPVKYASLAAAYTYSQDKYEEYVSGGTDYSDNYIERSPDHHFNARLTVFPVEHAWVELEMDAVSSQYSDPGNTREYGRPTLFNLRAKYDRKEWSFWAHLLNLTDQEYATYVSYSSSDSTTKLFPGSPMTFIAGISYRWGGDK